MLHVGSLNRGQIDLRDRPHSRHDTYGGPSANVATIPDVFAFDKACPRLMYCTVAAAMMVNQIFLSTGNLTELGPGNGSRISRS